MSRPFSEEHSDWLPTGQAAQRLGISACTLQRYRTKLGIFDEGTHFRRGPHSNSPLVWNWPRCFEAMSKPVR